MAYHHFSVEEREAIQRMRWEKRSIRDIGAALGRSPSSISREVKKNINKKQRYTPRLAHERALEHRSHRGRVDRLKNADVRRYVASKLKSGYSPEQIAGRAETDLRETISHEAIYQY